MVASARELVTNMWNEAFAEGLWAASWSKSLEGLSAAQAAWRPQNASGASGERHSAWQIVLHMCLWREHWLRKLAGQTTPREDLERLNFSTIADESEAAWAAARSRFNESQKRLGAALADPATSEDHFESIAHFLPHDCYHFGQINFLRAMQGLAPIE